MCQVHRDIKPENILFDRAGVAKLVDFGFAKKHELHSSISALSSLEEPARFAISPCGTPGFVAPEVLRHTGYNCAVDMWALGVIAYMALFGASPFSDAKASVGEVGKPLAKGGAGGGKGSSAMPRAPEAEELAAETPRALGAAAPSPLLPPLAEASSEKEKGSEKEKEKEKEPTEEAKPDDSLGDSLGCTVEPLDLSDADPAALISAVKLGDSPSKQTDPPHEHRASGTAAAAAPADMCSFRGALPPPPIARVASLRPTPLQPLHVPSSPSPLSPPPEPLGSAGSANSAISAKSAISANSAGSTGSTGSAVSGLGQGSVQGTADESEKAHAELPSSEPVNPSPPLLDPSRRSRSRSGLNLPEGPLLRQVLAPDSPTLGKRTLLSRTAVGLFAFPDPRVDPRSKDVSGAARDLISALLQVDPLSRLTAEQALEHPWFAEGATPPRRRAPGDGSRPGLGGPLMGAAGGGSGSGSASGRFTRRGTSRERLRSGEGMLNHSYASTGGAVPLPRRAHGAAARDDDDDDDDDEGARSAESSSFTRELVGEQAGGSPTCSPLGARAGGRTRLDDSPVGQRAGRPGGRAEGGGQQWERKSGENTPPELARPLSIGSSPIGLRAAAPAARPDDSPVGMRHSGRPASSQGDCSPLGASPVGYRAGGGGAGRGIRFPRPRSRGGESGEEGSSEPHEDGSVRPEATGPDPISREDSFGGVGRIARAGAAGAGRPFSGQGAVLGRAAAQRLWCGDSHEGTAEGGEASHGSRLGAAPRAASARAHPGAAPSLGSRGSSRSILPQSSSDDDSDDDQGSFVRGAGRLVRRGPAR